MPFPTFQDVGNTKAYQRETADRLFSWFHDRVSGDGWDYSALNAVSLKNSAGTNITRY